MIINGYQYITEQEAINARKLAADYKGLPVLNGRSLYWVNYNYAYLNEPPFYYIRYVDGLEAVLGQPTEFEVIKNDHP